jgi:DNA (cytosine-5)-methyltransferase 1
MRNRTGRKIVFADVFAGCGGLSLGLLQAGLQGRFAIEHDKFAFDTLRANLLLKGAKFRFAWPRWLPKEPIAVGTFLKEHEKQLQTLEGRIDVLVGGPPCQGFSSAGRRKHDDPRNELFESYLAIVNILKPRAVLIENVRGFTIDFNAKDSTKNYSHKLREQLEKNYEVHAELLDLSQFGVPQARTRYFLLAMQPGICDGNPFRKLKASLPGFLRSMRLNVPVKSWAAISDLEVSRGGTRPSGETPGFDEIHYTSPRTHFQRLMGASEATPTDLRLARHSATITERFRQIIELSHAEGRLNTSISEDTRARFGLQKRALRVLDPDRPSPTITSLPDDLLHYSEPRTLTVRETARLQSFPDWFSFKGKYTTGGHLRRNEVPRFTQVANAVPPLVARAIGEFLIDLFRASRGGRIFGRTGHAFKSIVQLPELAA